METEFKRNGIKIRRIDGAENNNNNDEWQQQQQTSSLSYDIVPLELPCRCHEQQQQQQELGGGGGGGCRNVQCFLDVITIRNLLENLSYHDSVCANCCCVGTGHRQQQQQQRQRAVGEASSSSSKVKKTSVITTTTTTLSTRTSSSSLSAASRSFSMASLLFFWPMATASVPRCRPALTYLPENPTSAAPTKATKALEPTTSIKNQIAINKKENFAPAKQHTPILESSQLVPSIRKAHGWLAQQCVRRNQTKLAPSLQQQPIYDKLPPINSSDWTSPSAGHSKRPKSMHFDSLQSTHDIKSSTLLSDTYSLQSTLPKKSEIFTTYHEQAEPRRECCKIFQKHKRSANQSHVAFNMIHIQPPKIPAPHRVSQVLHAVKSGLRACIELVETDIQALKWVHSLRENPYTINVPGEQRIKNAHRHLKRLELHLTQIEALEDTYVVHRRLRDGMRNMANAYLMAMKGGSTSGKSTNNNNVQHASASSTQALARVRASFKQCTRTLCALEVQLESMLGAFDFCIKGVAGFARVCVGDQYELDVCYGAAQRWRSRGGKSVAAATAGGAAADNANLYATLPNALRGTDNTHDKQTWQNGTTTLRVMLTDVLQISAIELKKSGLRQKLGLVSRQKSFSAASSTFKTQRRRQQQRSSRRNINKKNVGAAKLCDVLRLFSPHPQLMTIPLNATGSLKLNVVATWNPLMAAYGGNFTAAGGGGPIMPSIIEESSLNSAEENAAGNGALMTTTVTEPLYLLRMRWHDPMSWAYLKNLQRQQQLLYEETNFKQQHHNAARESIYTEINDLYDITTSLSGAHKQPCTANLTPEFGQQKLATKSGNEAPQQQPAPDVKSVLELLDKMIQLQNAKFLRSNDDEHQHHAKILDQLRLSIKQALAAADSGDGASGGDGINHNKILVAPISDNSSGISPGSSRQSSVGRGDTVADLSPPSNKKLSISNNNNNDDGDDDDALIEKALDTFGFLQQLDDDNDNVDRNDGTDSAQAASGSSSSSSPSLSSKNNEANKVNSISKPSAGRSNNLIEQQRHELSMCHLAITQQLLSVLDFFHSVERDKSASQSLPNKSEIVSMSLKSQTQRLFQEFAMQTEIFCLIQSLKQQQQQFESSKKRSQSIFAHCISLLFPKVTSGSSSKQLFVVQKALSKLFRTENGSDTCVQLVMSTVDFIKAMQQFCNTNDSESWSPSKSASALAQVVSRTIMLNGGTGQQHKTNNSKKISALQFLNFLHQRNILCNNENISFKENLLTVMQDFLLEAQLLQRLDRLSNQLGEEKDVSTTTFQAIQGVLIPPSCLSAVMRLTRHQQSKTHKNNNAPAAREATNYLRALLEKGNGTSDEELCTLARQTVLDECVFGIAQDSLTNDERLSFLQFFN